MLPILARLGPLDFGDALLATLGFFLLLLLWRKAARALGEEVPPLTVLGVLLNFLLSVGLAAGLVWLINRFGPVEIKSYGLMLVVGFAAGTLWCMHAGARLGYEPTVWLDLVLYLLVGAVIGARVVYVILDWHLYAGHVTQTLALWQGGLSFHGGVLGGIAGGAVYAWRSRQSFLKLSDIVAPAIALGYSFGRIGCFLNGCCYGRPTSCALGLTFPRATWIDGTPIHGPVHPTQLYASAASLLIFAVLVWVSPRLRRPGHTFVLYLVLYSVYRFFIEYLRRGATAVPLSFFPALTVGQFASLIVGAAGLLTLVVTWPRGGEADGD